MENVVNPWKKRRVFLTGHTGFKGGWLTLWLAEKGAVVRGYALAPEAEPNLFAAAKVGGAVDDVCADIRDFAEVHASMTEFAPEVVFHMAAQPLVRRSYVDPLGTYATNVMGTAHVLEAVRSCPSVRAMVCVATDKCYENREWVWPYREGDPLGGHDPYSSSKACAEMVAAAYRSSFFAADAKGTPGVGLATARAGNVIGGGDWSEDRLIPDLVRGFCTGEAVKIRRPGAIRPWQHVLEPLHGYMLLAERLLEGETKFAGPYNFGPTDEDAWTVERVADRMVEMWGKGAKWTGDAEAGVHEAHMLRLDASKARAELGWRPRLPTETALEWTVSWYRAWQMGAAMRGETLKQIANYERLTAG
ncbi:MAG TPA: CDP-glucose 4,6-dehydratase [Terracidiphilus sp.]|nr:CDP-glucose 4,6-dehydratase [Terracidiphilus sp.]